MKRHPCLVRRNNILAARDRRDNSPTGEEMPDRRRTPGRWRIEFVENAARAKCTTNRPSGAGPIRVWDRGFPMLMPVCQQSKSQDMLFRVISEWLPSLFLVDCIMNIASRIIHRMKSSCFGGNRPICYVGYNSSATAHDSELLEGTTDHDSGFDTARAFQESAD